MQKIMAMGAKFATYAPHFTGPTTADLAVKQVLSTMEKFDVDHEWRGTMISHLGTKKWL
jgi:hypothetical protein